MDGHAVHLTRVHRQLLRQLLLDQVVDADGLFGGHKEVGPRRVELHALDDVLRLFEWHLRRMGGWKWTVSFRTQHKTKLQPLVYL